MTLESKVGSLCSKILLLSSYSCFFLYCEECHQIKGEDRGEQVYMGDKELLLFDIWDLSLSYIWDWWYCLHLVNVWHYIFLYYTVCSFIFRQLISFMYICSRLSTALSLFMVIAYNPSLPPELRRFVTYRLTVVNQVSEKLSIAEGDSYWLTSGLIFLLIFVSLSVHIQDIPLYSCTCHGLLCVVSVV